MLKFAKRHFDRYLSTILREALMPSTTAVSQADIDALTKAMNAVKADIPPTSLTGPNPMQVFCQNWPTLKNILTTLQPVVGAIPGFGVVISGAISTLLLIGNAAYSAFCGGGGGS
jgi:hypothetical protein